MTVLGFRALVIALVVLAGAPALAIGADISVNQQSGVAPLAVFFDARGTTDSTRNGIERFLDLGYEWDFGDTTCENNREVWQISGKSRCRDLGPVAGHVYETPGTYTVTLTVNDGSQTSTTTTQITVTDPATVFSGSKTTCVSQNGDFSDPNGVCDNAVQITSSASFASLRNQYLSSGSRLLLHRGEAWSGGGDWTYSGTQDTIVGAYGVGSKPRINLTAERMFMFSSNSGLRIMDLDVHGKDDPSTGSVVYTSSGGQAKNLLVLRVDATDLAKPFQLQVNGGPTPLTGYMNNGIAIVDSTTRSRAFGGANNDFFGGSERFLFMGNDFGNADGTEHTLRFQYLKGAVVSHNRMGGSGVPKDKAVIKMHNIFDGKPCTEEVMLADNRAISGGASNVWGLSPANTSTVDECVHELRIERNHIVFNQSNGYRQIQLHGGDSLIANNILDLTGSNPDVRPHGIVVLKRMSAQTTPATNNRIFNNTCYMADSRMGMKCVVVWGSNNRVYNNLAYAPNMPVTDIDAAEDNGSSNVLSGNRIAASNPFEASKPSAWGDYKLGSGGANLVDAGSKLPTGLYTDFSGDSLGTRTINNSVDVGAHEDRGSAQGLPPAPTLLSD
jgi:hypothetical protein